MYLYLISLTGPLQGCSCQSRSPPRPRHSIPHRHQLEMPSQPESPPVPSTATGELEPRPDPELWFDDGNVVIVAGAAAFRVHTGVLSRHSEVFQDTFGVFRPALPAPSDVFGGQPVVHVSDSANDFKQLLCMLYDGAKCVREVDVHILDIP